MLLGSVVERLAHATPVDHARASCITTIVAVDDVFYGRAPKRAGVGAEHSPALLLQHLTLAAVDKCQATYRTSGSDKRKRICTGENYRRSHVQIRLH